MLPADLRRLKRLERATALLIEESTTVFLATDDAPTRRIASDAAATGAALRERCLDQLHGPGVRP